MTRNTRLAMGVWTFVGAVWVLGLGGPGRGNDSAAPTPVFLSPAALAHLREPAPSMTTELQTEISDALKECFQDAVAAAMGSGATTRYNAVTTLAGIRGDWETRMNRLEIISEMDAPPTGGTPEKVGLYIYLYSNDKLAAHFGESARIQREAVQRAIAEDEKARAYAREKKRPFQSRVLTLGPYTALPDGNGWRWYTDDARMSVLFRTLDFKVNRDWIADKTKAIHAQLAAAGLYGFQARLAPARELGLTAAEAAARATRLARALTEWEKTNKAKLIYENLAGKARLATYLLYEDGVGEPLRSSQEVAFYNRLKQAAATAGPGKVLTMDDLLLMALDVTPRNRDQTVNLFLANLTAHNVTKLLARPEQWASEFLGLPAEEGHHGHPPSDAVYPLLQDLTGIASSTDGPTLPAMLTARFDLKWLPDKTRVHDLRWSVRVFGQGGLFEIQPDTSLAEAPILAAHWNGGCHYYYWVGALAAPSLGDLGVWFGGRSEQKAKNATENPVRGKVELSFFRGGALFAKQFVTDRGLARLSDALRELPATP